ncbi:MAG: putative F420-dependent oxidoreductase [Frankiales bacterium]|nr:putative F420-dependent oxidoreductase [Frankiales bacterium]
MLSAAVPLLGFGLPVSGSWANRSNMVRIARRAEELGYTSLWSFQRLLYPTDHEMGPQYRSVHDPLITLAHVAAVTDTIRLGTAIVNAPFTAPIVLAKQLTSLDHVSDGRLDAGLGLGWAREEFIATGVPPTQRGARMDEYLECLRAIWTDDVVSFNGTFYTVPPSRVRPRPLQQPHPPILLGGTAEPALRRAGRLADGWISSSRQDLSRIGDDIATVRTAAAEAGRDPAALRFVVRGLVNLVDRPGSTRRPLEGTVEQVHHDLALLHGQGVTEVFIDLNFHPAIGTPDADPGESMRYAETVLEAFAPAHEVGSSRNQERQP